MLCCRKVFADLCFELWDGGECRSNRFNLLRLWNFNSELLVSDQAIKQSVTAMNAEENVRAYLGLVESEYVDGVEVRMDLHYENLELVFFKTALN